MEYVRKLNISKNVNMRDIGGYPISFHSCTSWGQFYRSDVPAEVSQRDINILKERNILTIIDMRNKDEADRMPCAFMDNNDFDYYHIPMYGDGKLPEDPKDVGKTYFEMVDEQTVAAKIFKIMIEAKNAVLFHCLAGKDRTGVVAAILLELAGAAECDIIADYMLTAVYISPIVEKFKLEYPDMLEHILIPHKEFMESFLYLFKQKYGSTANYLSEVGFTDNEILTLKKKLITKLL